ncbi:MAG: aminotransferase class III-fold pyridoxal phosphate-dependent enzyme, partial [Candidatus Dormibacteria bacterium]
ALVASLWAVASTATSTPLQSVRTGTGDQDVKARHRSGSLSCSATLKVGILVLAAAGHPVLEVRGRGLMLGVGLRRPIAREVARAALTAGLLINPVGQRTLRLLPALTLSEPEADLLVERLARALTATAESSDGTGPSVP